VRGVVKKKEACRGGGRLNGYVESWSQKTAFPQMQLQKDILDRAQNDWITRN